MSERQSDKRVLGLTVDGYSVRYGIIAGPDDPKQRRRVLQLVLHGGGWVMAATPVKVYAGHQNLIPIALEREGRDLVCLLDPIPPEGAPLIVQQWTRAESPEPFTRKKLPRGARPGPARKRAR